MSPRLPLLLLSCARRLGASSPLPSQAWPSRIFHSWRISPPSRRASPWPWPLRAGFLLLAVLGAGLDAGGDELHRVVHGNAFRRHVLRQGRVHLPAFDIGTVPARKHLDLLPSSGCSPRLFDRAAPRPRGLSRPALDFRDQGHRAVEPDGQNLLGVDLGVFAIVLQIGAVAAEAGDDRLAALGMKADLARQRQKLERIVQVTAAASTPLGSEARLGLSPFSPSPSWI